tara:strand:- start:283 stop:504 length:222 start_codon:yes stop_codon:yes gene_type:complete
VIEDRFKKLVDMTDSTMEEIRSKRRNHYILDNKKFIARQLRELGHSYIEIGSVMNKHPSTIVTLLNGSKRKHG